MARTRFLILGLLAVLVLGSLASTGGYAWYLRSAAYRRSCAADLSEMLDLPADIGQVVPRSRNSREFGEIVVWLPERRGEALYCETAVLTNRPTDENPDAYEIDLRGGRCEISNRTWLREDYREVIDSGLRPLFDPDGPQQVRLSGMDIVFARDGFTAALRGARGRVWFESLERGRVTILCPDFNGYQAAEAVFLDGMFSPLQTGIRMDEITLTIPRMPLETLGLRDLTGWDVRSGEFDGRLTYQETEQGQELTAAGHCFDLVLSEWTAGLGTSPWRGRCPEIELREFRVRGQTPARVRFAGVLTGVFLGDILAFWGLEDVGGAATLRVRDADLSPNGIDRLIVSGSCENVSLEKLSEGLGWGQMTGNLRLVISDLTIENNTLRSLDAEVSIADAGETPHWVEGKLLRELVTRTLKIDLPLRLPERIEYTRFGMRLEVRDEVLHVFGTHGPKQETILTLRIFGTDWRIPEPERAFDLSDSFDLLRAQATAYLEAGLRQLTPDDSAETE